MVSLVNPKQVSISASFASLYRVFILNSALFRQYYFPIFGTCWESLAGGHHFRAWPQNGSLANSGAWFLGASKEENSREHHTISKNGYNIGRDWLVERAVLGGRWKGFWWKADVEWREGLLEPGRDGRVI